MNIQLHHENANARSLGVVRACVFTLWLALFCDLWFTSVALPADIYESRGVVRLLPEGVLEFLLGPEARAVIPWVFIPVVAAAAAGLRPFRLWGAVSVLLVVMFDCWVMGFSGFVSHAMVLPMVMAGVLACSPSADGFAIGAGKDKEARPAEAYRFPLLVMLTAGLFCYMFMAVHRLVVGDYAVFNGESLRAWLLVRSQEPAANEFRAGTAVANSAVMFALYKAGFLVTTLMELASPFCLQSRRFARAWLVYFLIFHMLSLFTLNIFFWENSLMLPLLMLPLGTWIGGRKSADAGPLTSRA